MNRYQSQSGKDILGNEVRLPDGASAPAGDGPGGLYVSCGIKSSRWCYSPLLHGRGVPRRPRCYAVIVGSGHNLINRSDALFRAALLDPTKMLPTLIVPYVSASYGAVCYRLRHESHIRFGQGATMN